MTTDSYTNYLTRTKLCMEGNIDWNLTLGYGLIHICEVYVYISEIYGQTHPFDYIVNFEKTFC